jgi:hypothetical protein
VLPIAACALAWFAFYPRQVDPLDAAANFSEGGHTLYWRDIDFSGFVKVARLLWDYEPGLTLLAGIGAVFALARARTWWASSAARARRDLVVVLAYAVPYALALGVYKETCDRMLLPLIPFLALLGGYAASRAAGVVSRNLRPVVLAALLAVPVYGALRYVNVRDNPDTLEQCARWLEQASRAAARAHRGRRPSGEFNAVEADFFAREADLYKREVHDSFDDLDPQHRKRK